MISKLKYILDPLDREVLDRAFDEAWAAVHAKANALYLKRGLRSTKSQCVD